MSAVFSFYMQYKTFHIYCVSGDTDNAPNKRFRVRWLVGGEGVNQLKGKKSDDFLSRFFNNTLMRSRNRFYHNKSAPRNILFGGIKRRGNNHIAG